LSGALPVPVPVSVPMPVPVSSLCSLDDSSSLSETSMDNGVKFYSDSESCPAGPPRCSPGGVRVTRVSSASSWTRDWDTGVGPWALVPTGAAIKGLRGRDKLSAPAESPLVSTPGPAPAAEALSASCLVLGPSPNDCSAIRNTSRLRLGIVAVPCFNVVCTYLLL